jgi:hypothetical protein
MIILIPFTTDFVKRDIVLGKVQEIFPDADIISREDEPTNLVNVKRKYYIFNDVIAPFINSLTDTPDEENVLFMHQNIIINEEVADLFNYLDDNIFVSVIPRRMDNSSRCVAFKKSGFVKCFSYQNVLDDFKDGTTMDFISKKLDSEGLKYKWTDIRVEEL